MKRMYAALCVCLLAAPAASYASDQLVPAGSIVTCRVADGKISSKTTAIGDPVLCTLDPVEKYGRSVFPYGSYLEGRFEDYKDPGHFVGKGWMELKFDRLFIGNRVMPFEAKVIATPGYKVNQNGQILGKGHAVKDTITWLIPVLWPIDLINLPRRGPRPVLKAEQPLTLELMDDLGIPNREDRGDGYQQQQQTAQYQQQPALIERQPAPQQVIYQSFQQAPQQQAPAPVYEQPAPPQVIYQQPAPPVVIQAPPPRVVYRYPPPPPPVYYGYPRYRYYGPAY